MNKMIFFKRKTLILALTLTLNSLYSMQQNYIIFSPGKPKQIINRMLPDGSIATKYIDEIIIIVSPDKKIKTYLYPDGTRKVFTEDCDTFLEISTNGRSTLKKITR